MIVEHPILFTRTQIKMMDCWYACIRMVKGAVAGAPGFAPGAATQHHRSTLIKGQRLSFSSVPGLEIMRENNLVDIAAQIKLTRIDTLANALQRYGPLIACGKFAFFNTQGHCIVISGCNTVAGTVSIYDPGWGKGRDSKPWTYITKHIFKMMGSDSVPAACAFVADDPAVPDNKMEQQTRARR